MPTVWYNSLNHKMAYCLWFRQNVVRRYRPDQLSPMLQSDGAWGSSFFAIAENEPGSGYEEMEKRTGVPHHLLCGIDDLCRFIPLCIGQWYPFDALCNLRPAAEIPDNSGILELVRLSVNLPPQDWYQYSGKRFGLGEGLRHISITISDPMAVAIALLECCSRF